MAATRIRAEEAADVARVGAIHRAAFGRDAEARLVDALRAGARPGLSLVAEREGVVVGHAFFSPVSVEGMPAAPPLGALGPLAVAPAAQRQGAGAALVRAGLRACDAVGWQAVFVLGDPVYYGRLGFEPAAPLGLHYPDAALDGAFQVVELVVGALAGCRGRVHYHPAFTDV